MKGIILAGGAGTRLHPATKVVCKQLLAIYDKPMIHYPLSTLMLAGIREILIITTPNDIEKFKDLLGDGSQLGIELSYVAQENPRGLADAFIVGKDFIGSDSVCLVLGDNIFYGQGLRPILEESAKIKSGARIFGYYVNNPERYGVINFNSSGRPEALEEKPKIPKSNYAAVGLYFYDNSVIDIAKNVTPSKRGEIEITSINNEYLKRGQLDVRLLGRGYAWLDTGTPASMVDAANFVRLVEERQGKKISCLEEIAFISGYITKENLINIQEQYGDSSYGEYLKRVLSEQSKTPLTDLFC